MQRFGIVKLLIGYLDMVHVKMLCKYSFVCKYLYI